MQPYQGHHRKLVLAYDVGTTYSGAAYCILDPGKVPEVMGVMEYPGQEGPGRCTDTKIPSLLYYTKDGVLRAVGAEALADSEAMDYMEASDEFVLVSWFKLHLCPKMVGPEESNVLEFSTVKPVVEMWGDFLRYLHKCALQYITKVQGEHFLERLDNHIEFILSHPNGWGGPEQQRLRRAAVLGGLTDDNGEGHARISFVTEGEASFHYCAASGLASDAIEDNKGVMIVDAGGGTIDISSYKIAQSSPLLVQEAAPPDCTFQGSAYVNIRARTLLQDKLQKSPFGDDETIRLMLESFEKSTKPHFKSSADTAHIKFGGPRDNDTKHGIKSGRLSLTGTEMAALFKPSLTSIEEAIAQQVTKSRTSIATILLVGGFAASPYLYSQLQAICQRLNMQLFCPRSAHPAKAAAEGGILFHLNRCVSARMARKTYGTLCSRVMDPSNWEHQRRCENLSLPTAGFPVLPNGFATLLPKGTLVSEKKKFEKHLVAQNRDASALDSIRADITCYTGSLKNPEWTDEEPDNFSTLCKVEADTSHVPKTLDSTGTLYRQEFKLGLYFGLTELEAKISWMEEGVERESVAAVVYGEE